MRRQKRTFIKNVCEKGGDKETAETCAEILGSTGKLNFTQEIMEGEKVKLNIEKIKGRKDYNRLTDEYKEFVNSNVDTVFTAQLERRTLVSFAEEPRWLFWSGDLIKVINECGGEQ